MRELIKKVMGATKYYTVWDFGFLKVCLFSLGLLFGIYFSQFFSSYMAVVWVAFAVSYAFIMYRTFVKFYKK